MLEMKAPRRLGVWKMGVVNYLEALELQDELTSNRKILKVTDILLSLQHPPTYTLGKRRTDHNILVSESELKAMGADLHYTQRGGDVTFHGPHQAILYPIISLRDIGLGARQYVEKLETTMIQLASVHGVEARGGQKSETGVWVGGRKIGAIGVRISSGITSHGLAFNINPDMNYFKHIVPCGLEDKEVTSLQNEVKQVLPPDDVIHEQLISCFVSTFGYTDIIWKDCSSVVSFDQES
ncbi:octanoyltransferase LIP2, mitochondrial-like isoform X1 [Primulina huaijiensis]|uniref:octanoyltransferase LIP2, mitochondrial-like isoform X1 n=2 Tax=Primulina huaijiensis TaxID=1492673 RepID=UPI003CC6FF3E